MMSARHSFIACTIITVAVSFVGCMGGVFKRSETLKPLVVDEFKAPNGTMLQTHASSSGSTWVKHPFRNMGDLIIDNGRVHKDGGSNESFYFTSDVPESGEYDVSGDYYVASNVPMLFSAICGRMSLADKSMYCVWYSHSNTSWELNKFDGGDQTQLGRYVQEAVPGKTYLVKLQLRDAAKKVFIDGEERISSKDNTVTGPGRAGLYFISQDAIGEQASNAGYQIGNFRARAVAVDH